MCGIVGMISKLTNGFHVDERESFKDMLIMNQVRGMDGTGVFGVYHNRQCAVTKIGTNASNFVELSAFKKFEEKIFSQFWTVFGHNRKATQGSISSKNSHPFAQNNIVLIHNGTLTNHRSLADTEVDSEAIAVALNTGEPEDVLGKLNGAYALVWYDKRTRQINIARNHERPLYIASSKDCWFLSSETGIMAAAAMRNQVKLEDIEAIETGTIFKFRNGNSYEFSKIKKSYTSYRPDEYYRRRDSEEALACCPFADCSKAPAAAITTTPLLPAKLPVRPGRLHIPTTPNTAHPLPSKEKLNEDVKKVVDKLLRPVGKSTIPKVGTEICWVVEAIIPSSSAAMDGKILRKGWEIRGKVNRDGVDVDVIGFCSWPESQEMLERHLNQSRDERGYRWVSGEVLDSGANTCGPWAKCEDVTGETFVKVWNTKTLPRVIWNEIVQSHCCDKCAKPIIGTQADYTSVNYSGNGRINKITCADCVDKSVVIKEKNDDKTGTDSLSDGKQQQSSSGPTLH